MKSSLSAAKYPLLGNESAPSGLALASFLPAPVLLSAFHVGMNIPLGRDVFQAVRLPRARNYSLCLSLFHCGADESKTKQEPFSLGPTWLR
jgi:hypothetical protein